MYRCSPEIMHYLTAGGKEHTQITRQECFHMYKCVCVCTNVQVSVCVIREKPDNNENNWSKTNWHNSVYT